MGGASHDYTSPEVVGDGVVLEDAWLSVTSQFAFSAVSHQPESDRLSFSSEVNPNAYSNLARARAIGNSSYSPTEAITVYYNQGRNEIAAGNYLVPLTTAMLSKALGQANAQSGAQ